MPDSPKSRRARARKQLGIPAPVLEFKIKMEPWVKNAMVWTVKIFKTRGQMRRYLKFTRPDWKHEEDWAFTDQKAHEVSFCLWTCTDNCVTHEAYHMAAFWALWWAGNAKVGRSLGLARCIEWDTVSHERMAEAVGNIVSQFWKSFTDAGYPRSECHGWPK